MKIIINADDFGINEVVTAEIKRMIELGAISSTTIMANGRCLDEVKRFAKSHPESSYGVHLCLSEFESITKSPVLLKYGIIDEKGCFVHKQIFRVKKFTPELKEAIRLELSAQIETVHALGVSISHADSHHHVHTIYELQDVFISVLKRYGIKKIRIAVPFTGLRQKLHFVLWWKRNKLIQRYKKKFITADYFCSYASAFENRLDLKKYNTLELMCHPGHPGQNFVREMILVQQNNLLPSLNPLHISYKDL